jgi:hypothetical protein
VLPIALLYQIGFGNTRIKRPNTAGIFKKVLSLDIISVEFMPGFFLDRVYASPLSSRIPEMKWNCPVHSFNQVQQ